jgi:TRAP-type C4-dicarboxylate transport system permease large subunit
MDIFSAIIVVVPLIAPLAIYFGIDPFHLAIIFIANLELGYITPPVGMNLYLSSYRFEKDMPTVYKATLPFFLLRLFGVFLITYIPLLFY